jgi:hypothetical protein
MILAEHSVVFLCQKTQTRNSGKISQSTLIHYDNDNESMTSLASFTAFEVMALGLKLLKYLMSPKQSQVQDVMNI